jgi:HD-like signal output (HDOD) protein
MSQDEYFRFVQELAADLNGKQVKLPSFPDVVVRVRRALDDGDCTADVLADILSAEPVLASKILVFANSSYHNPAGAKIEGLNSAVGRIGFEKVRSVAISYAVEQLHDSVQPAPLKSELGHSWVTGQRTAALSEVITRQRTKLDSDAAFIAGLLQNIGCLYIFTKYETYPDLLSTKDSRQQLIDEWQAPIGESIVANWGFSDEIQATFAVAEPEGTRRRVEPNLADVIFVAKALLSGDKAVLSESEESQRLKLSEQELQPIMVAYEERLKSMAAAVAA